MKTLVHIERTLTLEQARALENFLYATLETLAQAGSSSFNATLAPQYALDSAIHNDPF
jgi:hypothetical protein